MPAVCRECEGIVANSSDQSNLCAHPSKYLLGGHLLVYRMTIMDKGSKTFSLHEIKVEHLESVNMTLSGGVASRLATVIYVAMVMPILYEILIV